MRRISTVPEQDAGLGAGTGRGAVLNSFTHSDAAAWKSMRRRLSLVEIVWQNRAGSETVLVQALASMRQ